MTSKELAYQQIEQLVQRFEEQIHSYKKVDVLQLPQQKQQTTLSTQQEQLAQRILYTDDKINKLVYELYGLSEEEVRVVVEGVQTELSIDANKKLRQTIFVVKEN
ncbi:MAG TPA: hypothetical protein VN958_21355 [Chitinophagaceae bacterium]|nr:hypothetical protein [Chitinophagaceae bacterium]